MGGENILGDFPMFPNQKCDNFQSKPLTTILNIQVFDTYAAGVQSMNNYLSFETNPRVLGQFLWKWKVAKDSFFKKRPQKMIWLKKMVV